MFPCFVCRGCTKDEINKNKNQSHEDLEVSKVLLIAGVLR